jgi:hypothetical protein
VTTIERLVAGEVLCAALLSWQHSERGDQEAQRPDERAHVASRASSVTPDLVTNAPSADTPKDTHPIMLIHSACQSRDLNSTIPTAAVTATTPNKPLTRNASDPVASGTQTRRRSGLTACAHNEAPVLMLNKIVPANCVAAESHPIRSTGPDNTNCIHPAVVKNQEPMKHNRFTSPAPAIADNPGIVAIAKNVEPMAKSQHCHRSVAT